MFSHSVRSTTVHGTPVVYNLLIFSAFSVVNLLVLLLTPVSLNFSVCHGPHHSLSLSSPSFGTFLCCKHKHQLCKNMADYIRYFFLPQRARCDAQYPMLSASTQVTRGTRGYDELKVIIRHQLSEPCGDLEIVIYGSISWLIQMLEQAYHRSINISTKMQILHVVHRKHCYQRRQRRVATRSAAC